MSELFYRTIKKRLDSYPKQIARAKELYAATTAVLDTIAINQDEDVVEETENLRTLFANMT